MTQQQSSRKIMRRKHRRDVDRRRIQREKLRGLSGPLDPIDVILRALLEESRDSDARIADATAQSPASPL